MASSRFRRSALFASPALLVALAALAGCGGAEVADGVQPTLTTVPAPVTVASVPPPPPPVTAASGSPFTAADGRFSAQFPTPPSRAERSGGGLTFVVYGTAEGDRQVSVGYADYPKDRAKNPRDLLRTMAEEEGMLRMTDTTFLGRPALDIAVPRVEEGVTRYLHERSFMAGTRMYFLRGWSATPATPPDHTTLISTFKLTG